MSNQWGKDKMSEQGSHEAEVLLGRRNRFSDSSPLGWEGSPARRAWQNTYTLMIESEYVLGN
jgi:hypothetical protein